MTFSVELRNDSCVQNITDASVQQGALTVGLTGISCFILNLVGLTAELIFVCTKKNTFLLRLFVYLSIAVTMVIGCYSSFILMYFWPGDQFLCRLEHTFYQYSIAIELSLVFSITILLLYKLSSSFQLSDRKHALIERFSNSQRKCLEALFLCLNLGIPAVALSVMLAIKQKVGICFLTVKDSMECYIEEGFFFELLVFELLPVSVTFFLSVVCVCVLLVWLCWLRTRQLLKARMRTVMKEVGVWLVFLMAYCVVEIILEFLFNDIAVLKFIPPIVSPILHSFIPIIFFVYMYISLHKIRKKNVPYHQVEDEKATIQSAGLQTVPPSTRVSLPSDTAAHAPNLLSPSVEFTNTSPLLA